MMQAAGPGSVIVADNDALTRDIIRSVLTRAGLLTLVAEDGAEAVNLASQFQARLVLLDIGMPNLNGLLACEAIRALPGYAMVPIVMLTTYSDERMRQSATELGANDFITKPFNPDELMVRLAAHLDLPTRIPAMAPAAGDAKIAPKGFIRAWTSSVLARRPTISGG